MYTVMLFKYTKTLLKRATLFPGISRRILDLWLPYNFDSISNMGNLLTFAVNIDLIVQTILA